MLPKRSLIYIPVICYLNSGPLKVLNDSAMILKESEWPSLSFKTNFETFRTFRGPLFAKKITGRELLFGSTVHTISSNM